ncbi:MAG: PQQ-dependent dehydrogenase, methanol/ethanol family, partial [Alphaproteobacteria bacterium]|nr:PQQ-dependent dehydrogenase, methanol/ethanol family [Alphaproteobacteria bacterium]
MASENARLWMVAAAVGAVLAIPVLGARFGGPATTVTNVISGTQTPDIAQTQAMQKMLAQAADIDGARIQAADAEPQNWLAHGRTYGEQRFSPLEKINAGNVK